MVTALTYVGQLQVLTCWCGMRHAVPEELREFQLRQHRNGEDVTPIYCPLGHDHVPSGKGKARIEQEKREAAERELANAREDIRIQAARANKAEAETKRLKTRSTGGVCPCCNRSFVQLERHMKTKHPTVT